MKLSEKSLDLWLLWRFYIKLGLHTLCNYESSKLFLMLSYKYPVIIGTILLSKWFSGKFIL
jgi:hypothetical protein